MGSWLQNCEPAHPLPRAGLRSLQAQDTQQDPRPGPFAQLSCLSTTLGPRVGPAPALSCTGAHVPLLHPAGAASLCTCAPTPAPHPPAGLLAAAPLGVLPSFPLQLLASSCTLRIPVVAVCLWVLLPRTWAPFCVDRLTWCWTEPPGWWLRDLTPSCSQPPQRPAFLFLFSHSLSTSSGHHGLYLAGTHLFSRGLVAPCARP